MAAPVYIAASTGATDAGGDWTATCHAPGAAGRVIILQVLQDGSTSYAVTLTGATNITALDGTSNAWTTVNISAGTPHPVGSSAAFQFLWIGRSTGTSAPTASGTNVTSEDLYWRFYEFSDVSTGTTLATVIENSAADNISGLYKQEIGTSATAADAGVTTLGPDRLALNFVAVNDDNAIAQFSGQTGGTWVEVGEYAESSGTDGAIQLQYASDIGIANFIDSISTDPIFGGTGTYEQLAQSFTNDSARTIDKVALAISLISGGGSDNLIVEIQSDSSGVPSGTVVGSSVTTAISTLAPGRNTFSGLAASLSSSTTYWIVVRRSGTRDTSYYPAWQKQSSSTYSGGVPAIRGSGTWSTGTNDYSFVVFYPTTIDGGTASITDSDAWGVVGLALIGTTVAATTSLPPIRPYPYHLITR